MEQTGSAFAQQPLITHEGGDMRRKSQYVEKITAPVDGMERIRSMDFTKTTFRALDVSFPSPH